MTENNSIEEIFFKYLSQLKFDEAHLDYSVVSKHARVLQTLSDIGNSGTSIFDLCKRQIIFYSSNFGAFLGYDPADYKEIGQTFFATKIHPDDSRHLSINGVTAYKIFYNFSSDEKLNHKLIYEYRMLNAQNQYIRLVEQYQVLELDAKGQIWLMFTTMDLSPNQEELEGSKKPVFKFQNGENHPN